MDTAPVPTRTGAVPVADRSASAPPARTHRQPVVEGHQSERVDMEGSEPAVPLEPSLRQEGTHLSSLQPAHHHGIPGICDLEPIEQPEYGLPVHAFPVCSTGPDGRGHLLLLASTLHRPGSSRALRLLARLDLDPGRPGFAHPRHVYAQHAALEARLDAAGLYVGGN